MAVDLINNMAYRKETFITNKMEESAVQEAASGLESVNKLIHLLSQQNQNQSYTTSSSISTTTSLDLELNLDCNVVADVAVSKFKRVISLLGRSRTGHARFRRGPVLPPPPPPPPPSPPPPAPQVVETHKVYHATPIQQVPSPFVVEKKDSPTSAVTINFSSCNINNMNSNNSSVVGGNSFMSSLTGKATLVSTLDQSNISNKPQVSSCSAPFQVTNMSAGKPPLSSSSSLKRKCSSDTLASGKCSASSSGRCHCSKKRKLKLKRVVRVPAISLKMADIPPDDYSWRKYGQKPIKGSPYPRGYYKCSSLRGCPARKHVERALDDPSMLVVTYEGEHNHNLSVAETSSLILESS